MREVFYGRAATGGFEIEPAHWAKTITEKIDGMLVVEHLAADNIQAAAGIVSAIIDSSTSTWR